MNYEVTGKITHLFDVVRPSDKFSKREFIICVQEGQYNQYIKLQCTQKNIEKLDGLAVGSDVTAHFNLRGRIYTDRDGKENCFTSLDVWRIVVNVGEAQSNQPKANDPADLFDNVPF